MSFRGRLVKLSQLVADSIEGATITGAFIRTAATGKRWELKSTPEPNKLLGYSGRPGENQPGEVTVDYDDPTGYAICRLKTPAFNPWPTASIELSSSVDGTKWTKAAIVGQQTSIWAYTDFTVRVANSAGPQSFYAAADQSYMRAANNDIVYVRTMGGWIQLNGPVGHDYFAPNGFISHAINNTSTAGTTVVCNSSNGIVGKSSSGLVHKVDVRRLVDYLAEPGGIAGSDGAPYSARASAAAFIGLLDEIPEPEPTRGENRGRMLDVAPIIYKDRHESEMHASGDPAWAAEPRDWIGWAADDVAAIGWEELITRDPETGAPDYLHYERVLPVVVLELKAELDELRAETAALRAETAALRAETADLRARLDALETS